ncbi:hypothetical protein ACFFX0_27235 [Citricoccus parietis]|uniref:Uncharacterized protein n=1 Tax=Citricoccus parietis TaxID=592307 RepID=A0ABV5G8D9_9MICC
MVSGSWSTALMTALVQSVEASLHARNTASPAASARRPAELQP